VAVGSGAVAIWASRVNVRRVDEETGKRQGLGQTPRPGTRARIRCPRPSGLTIEMTIHIGTSGWSYDHWSDVLYPPGAPSGSRLGYYTRSFRTVELNSSFYRWPRVATFRGWRRRLPDAFQFSVKAPRGLTHGKKLYAPEAWVERIAACWHELGDKRAALLVQLAPDHARDDARLGYFLELLPPWIRTSVELRHRSWNDEHVFAMLEHHEVAYCVMSGAHLPCVLRATAPFVYVRLHGPDPHHL
jgi:uncharacterized protein YecE (DUF72 family)